MERALRVLGIDVAEDLVARWVGWFAPDPQPFLVGVGDDLGGRDGVLSPELRDTFEIYAVPEGLWLCWLTEADFADLPRPRRAEVVRAQVRHERGLVPTVRGWRPVVGDATSDQADGHRFVWWPRLLAGHEHRVLTHHVNEGRRPSQHRRVPASVWRASEGLLPDAQRLAGRFPASSGPNCFGTVMAAAGIEGAEAVWLQREPFEEWLSRATVPGGNDAEAGTVLVWRSPEGAVEHAAVTLGGGWAMHKPSQGWMSPTKVLAVHDVMASARSQRRRLSRRRLVA
ncbi:MAG: hypothetical protein JWN77_1481 [Frankiales bacterium]|jgi:hypothetical protein|nr:hypothetical protein [Frankiales bacterium]